MFRLMLTGVLLLSASSATAADDVEQREPDPRCGLYTLYVGLLALDADVEPFAEFSARLGEPPPGGFSLGELEQAAKRYSMHTLGVKTSAENLIRRPGPFSCIAHVRGNHFVNLGEIENGIVSVIDPPRSYTMPVDTLNSQWDGTALLIAPSPLLAEEDLPRPFPWVWIVGAGLAFLVALTIVAFVRRKFQNPLRMVYRQPRWIKLSKSSG